MKTIKHILTSLLLTPLLFCAQEDSKVAERDDKANEKPGRVFHESRFDWGVQAGATYGMIELGDLGRLRNEIVSTDKATGLQLGVFIQPQSDMFYIKPGLFYTMSSGLLNNRERTDFRIQKLELPMLFGIRVWRHFCVEGGPVLAHVLNITEQVRPYGDITTGRNGLGYHAGIAWDNNIIIVKAAMQGITYENPGMTTSFRERNTAVLSVAYKFSKPQKMSMGTKRFRKVYIPKGNKKIRINYF